MRGNLNATHPDMSKDWLDGVLAVKTKILCDKGDNGHGNAKKAVLEDTKPDYLNVLVHLKGDIWS